MLGRRIDGNQNEIVHALIKAGASVLDCHTVGRGMPDIIVGYHRQDFLLEIKNPKSKGKLSPRQVKWHQEWRGSPVVVVRTVDEALAAIGAVPTQIGICQPHPMEGQQ